MATEDAVAVTTTVWRPPAAHMAKLVTASPGSLWPPKAPTAVHTAGSTVPLGVALPAESLGKEPLTFRPLAGIVGSVGSARPSAMPPPLTTAPAGHATTALVVVAAAFVMGRVVAATWMPGPAAAVARPAAKPPSEPTMSANVTILAVTEADPPARAVMAAIPPFFH